MNEIGETFIIKPTWKIGQLLYFRTDREGLPHIVIGYEFRPKEPLRYMISYMTNNLVAYEEELTTEEPEINVD